MSHRHVCRCGSFFVCQMPKELCQVKHWDCPACEDKAMTDYFDRSATDEPQQPNR